jgi:uncharacterized protein DUF6983
MAETVNQVPLVAQPQRISVSLVGVTYVLTVRWSPPNQAWMLDVADSAGTPVASAIPLITGADLLEQLGYLGIGGQMIVQTDNDTDAVPTLANLGTNGQLYFLTS